jgi:dolichyl-phosphate beta-glucosyltransferase
MNEPRNKLYSLVMPVYNEQAVIGASVEAVKLYLDGLELSYELILVDDGSTDDTVQVISRYLNQIDKIRLLRNLRNEGKGSAVKLGIFAARGDYVMFMDADLSVPIKELSKIFKHIDESTDIVIGVRDAGSQGTVIKRPFYRKVISFLYNLFCNGLFFKGKMTDIGCGFKLFKKDIALNLFSNLYIKSWVFDVEILFKAISNNYKIRQVPVDWAFKGRSKVNVFKDLVMAVGELLRLKLFLWHTQKDSSCA